MTLQSSHSNEEIHELLAVGLEFPNLDMVKIEPDHSIPDVHSLISKLNEWGQSNWDISPSSEQYIKENGRKILSGPLLLIR